MGNRSLYDLIVIGAGPAGISLAVEAVNSNVGSENILVLEKFENHSWSIRKFYPDDKLVTANYKGQDVKCDGNMCLLDSSKDETLDYLTEAITNNNIKVLYSHPVSEIKKLKNGQYTVCANDECFVTKTIGIAIGVLGKPNRPSYKIPTEISSKVFFDVTTEKLTKKNVLVVGGGDSASEYSQYLISLGNKVSLCYRKEEFTRMNDINLKYVYEYEKSGQLNVLRSTDINSIEKDNDSIKVNFADDKASQKYDAIVYALGGTTPKNFLEGIGIKMTKEGPEVSDFFESTHEGIFLIGDLTAGKGGGSINVAFNSSHKAMKEVCHMYLDCKN
jgi:thioredoxin reductase (NADPH)